MNMSPTPSATKTLARFVRISLAALACAGGGLGLTAACLERPVVKATPNTTNLFVDQIKQTTIDKIDLLFMIDNSVSMSDKQRMLTDAVPSLLKRLITPNCVSLDKNVSTIMQGLDACPMGFEKEFSKVSDIHIGVISSSLGAHGANQCPLVTNGVTESFPDDKNDKGHLMGTTARAIAKGIPTYGNSGFLAWDPQKKYMPAGEINADTLITNFQNLVSVTGERGCGYEAQLESWYRFLVEPEPYLSVSRDETTSTTVQAGLDTALLDQRKAFLRADSLLAIIMLTDENDCSVVDEGLGWLVGTSNYKDAAGITKPFNFPRPTTKCETEPNSPCCRTCGSNETSPPMGCDALGADPQCIKEPGATGVPLKAAKDPPNLRCFNQKKRFGLDLLYPTERYVVGLQAQTLLVPDRTDPKGLKTKMVPNPIYTDLQGTAPFVRGPELVFLAGIVGVPWQDIADDASVKVGNEMGALKYLTWTELSKKDSAGKNVWDDILGTGKPPNDPLMIESIEPRTGTNPRTGKALAPATSTDPKANPINGHEFNNLDNDGVQSDLQYACIFPLPEGMKDCTDPKSGGCDCGVPPTPGLSVPELQTKAAANNSPLCNPPAGGVASTTQYAAKGYPGPRFLQVLKDYGPNSIVASICPKIVSDKANPSYGYNPAVTAIIDRLKEALGGRCLPRKLSPTSGVDETTGKALPPTVPCKVIEARIPKPGEACGCGEGREPGVVGVDTPTDTLKLANAVRAGLQSAGNCGTAGKPCTDYCLCGVTQLAGFRGCEFDDPPPAALAGYCYIDKAQNIGNPALVSACPASQQRKLRFVGANTPASGAVTFIACAGASAEDPDVMTVAPAAQ